MKRRGFTHAEQVKGGKARAAMRRGARGRFARLLHGGPKHRTTIHIDAAQLNRMKAEKALAHSGRRHRRGGKVFRSDYAVVRTQPKRKKYKQHNPKYHGTLGGF